MSLQALRLQHGRATPSNLMSRMENADHPHAPADTDRPSGGPAGGRVRRLVRALLPRSLRRNLAQTATRATRLPPVGGVRFGSLRRLEPISDDWGFDRGQPIDRYHIERFLEAEQRRIRGRVLEIDTDDYTVNFGGSKVTRSDVLHLSERLPGVTLIGDLATGEGIPEAAFDCVVVTQTLQLIYDVHGAVRTLHQILRPGGTALVTFPGLSRITTAEDGSWGSYWALTSHSAGRLFGEAFADGEVDVRTAGNVLTATAFLQGIAAEELTEVELEHRDPDYELLVTVRATRAAENGAQGGKDGTRGTEDVARGAEDGARPGENGTQRDAAP